MEEDIIAVDGLVDICLNAEIGTVACGNESGIGVFFLKTAATAVCHKLAILLVYLDGVHEYALLTVLNCSGRDEPSTESSIASFCAFVKGFSEKFQIYAGISTKEMVLMTTSVSGLSALLVGTDAI